MDPRIAFCNKLFAFSETLGIFVWMPPEEDWNFLKLARIGCSVASMWIIELPKVFVQHNFVNSKMKECHRACIIFQLLATQTFTEPASWSGCALTFIKINFSIAAKPCCMFSNFLSFEIVWRRWLSGNSEKSSVSAFMMKNLSPRVLDTALPWLTDEKTSQLRQNDMQGLAYGNTRERSCTNNESGN